MVKYLYHFQLDLFQYWLCSPSVSAAILLSEVYSFLLGFQSEMGIFFPAPISLFTNLLRKSKLNSLFSREMCLE